MPINSSRCNLDWTPDNFEYVSLQGTESSFYNSFGQNGLLLMFICNHCPYVKSIESKISSETVRLRALGVNSIAIMANDQASYTEDSDINLITQIQSAKFEFPYAVDKDQSIAKSFDAQCTPEFYYFNIEKKLKYRGRLDSNGKNSEMGEPELYNAVEEIISKGYSSAEQHPSVGCSIKWKN